MVARAGQAGHEASVCRHRLSLFNISIYLDKFMLAGYQLAAEMLYLSNIWTQEGNQAQTASTQFQNMAGRHFRASQTGDRKQSLHFY